MGDLLNFQVWAQLAPAADTSDRTSGANWLTEAGKPSMAVSPDGYQLGGAIATEDIETEHRYRGIRYTILTQRNSEIKNLQSPLFPEKAGLLLNMAVAQTAAGLPKYHQGRQWFEPGVLTGDGIGRQSTGILGKSLALSFDRGSPAGLIAQIGCFINRDSEISKATSYAVTDASNATPIVVTIGAHSFVAGDTVVVASVGGNTAANGTWTISAVTSTTITLQGSAGNGSWTSGGTVVRTVPPGTSSGTSLTFPTQTPYISSSTYIDVDFANVAAVTISAATAATPIVLTVPTGHGFANNDYVQVSGGVGLAGLNGSFFITSVGATAITLVGSAGTGTYTASTAKIALLARWGGDNADVRSLTFNYDNQVALDVYRPNDTADLNQTWTKAYAGTPTLTMQLVLIFANSAYANYHRIAGLRKFRTRIMAVGPTPSFSTTVTNNEAAGATVIECPSTLGLAVGDVLLFNDAVAGKQCVGTVASFVADTSVTLSGVGLDVPINTGSTIKNTAWELKIHSADMKTAPLIGNADQVKGVTIDGDGRLIASLTEILTVKAYDDDNV